MNSKFYNLPLDRQKQIINGALKVFSDSSYRQASTIDIAREAGISKGRLFYYFKNKIEDNFKYFLERVDKSKFREGVDVALLLQSLNWCADGFTRSALNSNKSIDEIDKEFRKILELYKKNFYKEDIKCTTVNTETEKIIP
ncbi:MAG: TetR/AcrR family transcriptional regulator [Clostridiaceae bacterium]